MLQENVYPTMTKGIRGNYDTVVSHMRQMAENTKVTPSRSVVDASFKGTKQIGFNHPSSSKSCTWRKARAL
jgi:hypothetical protein